MKEIADYRTDMLTLLGDASGRRYSESILDMGLREALGEYRTFCPRKETVRQKVLAVDGWAAILPGFLEPGIEILTVRNDSGVFLEFAEYRTAEKVYLNFYGEELTPAAGTYVMMELSCPQMIKGLDEATQTTVPDAHALTLCKGAAGYAMRIRARSVTEVFGKRPEDREALNIQADQLITDFLCEMARIQPAALDPLPRGNFSI